MGAIVVFYHLPALVITVHLLIAMIFLAILIGFWRYNKRDKSRKGEPTMLKNHLTILTILLFITIGIGAYVKHQHYGLACGYLDCGDTILPASIPELLHSIHRLLAFVSTLHIMFVTFKVLSVNNSKLKVRMILALLVILLQLVIGMMTIVSFISISFAVLHLAAATLLFAIIVEARITVD